MVFNWSQFQWNFCTREIGKLQSRMWRNRKCVQSELNLNWNDNLIPGNLLIIYNWCYITEICQFSDCYISGGSDISVGSVGPFAEEKCARLVKKEKPDALGATSYSYGNCKAEYGTKIISAFRSVRCCLFPGNISSCLLIFIF